MTVGLASYRFINNDIPFNLSQIERALSEARGKAELLCFGEAFLQGFSALNWDYAHDREIAVTQEDPLISRLQAMTVQYGVDLAFGYLEREEELLFSSFMVIEAGQLLHNYRRVSVGWKEYWHTDCHYREGWQSPDFSYKGQPFRVALCGDLWEYPTRFATEGVLLWPVCCNYTRAEWQKEQERAYAAQGALAAGRVLLVDAVESGCAGIGAAYFFEDGNVKAGSPMEEDGILYVEIV